MLTRRNPPLDDIIQLRVPLFTNILEIFSPRRRTQDRIGPSDGIAEGVPVNGVFELVDYDVGLLNYISTIWGNGAHIYSWGYFYIPP